VKIIPFEPAHYITLSRAIYAQWPPDALARPELLAETYALGGGAAFTGLDEETGEPIACAGVLHVWQGNGTAWAIITKAARPTPTMGRAVHYGIARIYRQLCQRYAWRSVHAYVSADDARSRRWMPALGFRRLCLLEAFGPGGEAFELWAWYRHRG
jgi:RimJ/RimL family protein N-acetyltransferase